MDVAELLKALVDKKFDRKIRIVLPGELMPAGRFDLVAGNERLGLIESIGEEDFKNLKK